MRTILWGVGLIILGALAAVRLTPIDPAVVHVDLDATQDEDLTGGAIRVIDGDAEMLRKLDAIARATPRTKVVGGTVDEGHITYVTRSFWIGFPDYTTVQQKGGRLVLFARLRFGSSDLGVNRARLEGWLAQL